MKSGSRDAARAGPSSSGSAAPAGLGGAALFKPVRPAPVSVPGSSSSRASAPRGELPVNARAVEAIFKKHADEAGLVFASRLRQIMTELRVPYDETAVVAALGTPDLSRKPVTIQDVLAVALMLSEQAGSTHSPNAASSAASSSFKRFLSQTRPYLETGFVTGDDAVLMYMLKLQEHKKKCEAAGKYDEALAANKRLQELRVTQAEKMRQELVANQSYELQEAARINAEESAKWEAQWAIQLTEYERNLEAQVDALRAQHAAALEAFNAGLEAKRPVKPRNSVEYLNQRRVQELLAKSGAYAKARAVKEAADALYDAEFEETQRTFDAECRLKRMKFLAKQQQEADILVHRGAKGRDALEMKRQAEGEKRANRYRCVVAELESAHRHEIVQLESFAENHAQAGKHLPLKVSNFRRRNEVMAANSDRVGR